MPFKKGHKGFRRKYGKNPFLSEYNKQKKGDKNHRWIGDKVKYNGLHMWVRRWKGKPNKCEECGIEKGNFDWANKSGKYLRNLDDWNGIDYLVSLCSVSRKLKLLKLCPLTL